MCPGEDAPSDAITATPLGGGSTMGATCLHSQHTGATGGMVGLGKLVEEVVGVGLWGFCVVPVEPWNLRFEVL